MLRESKTEVDLELSRIEAEYRHRDDVSRYSLFKESALLHFHSQERNLLALLKRHNFTNLAEKKILDVGCGDGGHLRRFLNYGAVPENISGIDLTPTSIERAQRFYPTMNWQVGSAHQLPYPDNSFGPVTCNVVFSSILSESLQQGTADEMWRVCKPDGVILFFDFMYSNPRNPAVRGVTSRQIQILFNRPQARFDFRRILLAPPLHE